MFLGESFIRKLKWKQKSFKNLVLNAICCLLCKSSMVSGRKHVSSRQHWKQNSFFLFCFLSEVLVNQLFWSEHIYLYNRALLCFNKFLTCSSNDCLFYFHVFSCHSAVEVKLSRRVAEHFHFGVYAAFSELGAARWCSWDFWLLVLLIMLLWFVRLYLHYCSQWIFLKTISVPVTK